MQEMSDPAHHERFKALKINIRQETYQRVYFGYVNGGVVPHIDHLRNKIAHELIATKKSFISMNKKFS